MPLSVNVVGKDGNNISLLDAETLVWNGTATELSTSDIPNARSIIMVRVNNQADQEVNVKLAFKVGSEYFDYKGADGSLLTFTAVVGEHSVFGPIQGFPLYDGGRITVTADTPPSNLDETTIQVQGV